MAAGQFVRKFIGSRTHFIWMRDAKDLLLSGPLYVSFHYDNSVSLNPSRINVFV